MTDKKKAIEGQIIPKNTRQSAKPADQKSSGSSLASSFKNRVKGYALQKSIEAATAVEEAKAQYEAATLRRMANQEKAARQLGRISRENLEKMSEAESNAITAELQESRQRIARANIGKASADAAENRQKKQDDIEDLKLEVELMELKSKLEPKPIPSKNQQQYTYKDRLSDILAHGASGKHEKQAREEIASLIEQAGGEENLTDEQRENIKIALVDAQRRDLGK